MEFSMAPPDINEDEIKIDDDQEEEDLHVEYDIAVYPSDLTLKVIKEMYEDEDISIPPFQRRFVWTIKQSSQLIESFLRGLPVPQVFFYIDDVNRNLVIDGQQRILSIIYYFDGYFGQEGRTGKRQVFRLQGLSSNSPFLKKRFKDLDQSSQRKLESSVLRAVNVRQLSPQQDHSSVYHIFERLNTGGTPLRPQEIRNCVFSGKLVDELNQINALPAWREIIGRRELEKHQRDVEMILRIFAFWEHREIYDKPMKGFLNRQMLQHKNADSLKFKKFRNDFEQTMNMIVRALHPKPFHVRGPINLAALDSIASLTIKNIRKIPDDYAERVNALLEDEEYRDAIFFNTSDTQAVQKRMMKADEILFRQ